MTGIVKFIHTKLKANQFVPGKIITKNYIFWYTENQAKAIETSVSN